MSDNRYYVTMTSSGTKTLRLTAELYSSNLNLTCPFKLVSSCCRTVLSSKFTGLPFSSISWGDEGSRRDGHRDFRCRWSNLINGTSLCCLWAALLWSRETFCPVVMVRGQRACLSYALLTGEDERKCQGRIGGRNPLQSGKDILCGSCWQTATWSSNCFLASPRSEARANVNTIKWDSDGGLRGEGGEK